MSDDKDDKRDLKEAQRVLLEKAEAVGLKVDARWSVDTLAERVLEAERAKSENDKSVEKAASTQWVFLLRDGFPVEDEKHLAGETIQVTPAIADKWFEAGVARPAKAPVADD